MSTKPDPDNFRTTRDPYVDQFVALYGRMAFQLPGFRLPIPDPIQIEGDYDGRTTAMLFILGFQNTCRMSEVAEIFNIHPSTATFLVDKWVKKKLIRRKPSKEDRRVVLLELDAKGRDILTQVDRHVHDALARLFAPLTREEKQQLIDIFQKVADNVE